MTKPNYTKLHPTEFAHKQAVHFNMYLGNKSTTSDLYAAQVGGHMFASPGHMFAGRGHILTVQMSQCCCQVTDCMHFHLTSPKKYTCPVCDTKYGRFVQ